jgi:hypothetical protein
MAPLPPTSPSSPGTTTASPRLLHSSGSGEWSAVVRRNVKSSLLLLLVLSTVFVFSVLYSSQGFGSTAAEEVVVLTRRPLVGDPDVSGRPVPGEEEKADEPVVPAENNVARERSSPEEISLPSADSSSAPTATAASPSTAERTGDQSNFQFRFHYLRS